MRHLSSLALALVAGCDFPEDRDQTWPPDRTISVVMGADVDRDGPTDLIAFTKGTGRSRGAYVVKGGEDLVLESPFRITSFSSFHPMQDVLAAVVVDELHIAVVTETTVGLVSTATFRALSGVALGEPVEEAWLRRLSFADGDHLLIGASSRVWAVPLAGLVAANAVAIELPAPPESWAGSKLATVSRSAGGDVLAIATATKVYRTTITGTIAELSGWETVRDGPPWDGQTAFDMTGDGNEEILGFETGASRRTCAIDINAIATGCLAASDGPFAGAQMLVDQLAGDPRPDIVLIQFGVALSAIERFEDCSLSGPVLEAARVNAPGLQAGHTPFHLVIASDGTARDSLIAIDQVGFPYCLSCR